MIDRPRTPRLTTQRLVLVPQTLAVARAIVAGSDPGLPVGPGYPHDDSLDALRRYAEHGETDGEGGWFVTLAADGSLVGEAGTKGWVDDDGEVEIGYGLAGPARGRGLGTETVRAIVAWLADQPAVRRIAAEVEPGNLPSARLLERVGFLAAGRRDGCLRYIYRSRAGGAAGH